MAANKHGSAGEPLCDLSQVVGSLSLHFLLHKTDSSDLYCIPRLMRFLLCKPNEVTGNDINYINKTYTLCERSKVVISMHTCSDTLTVQMYLCDELLGLGYISISSDLMGPCYI